MEHISMHLPKPSEGGSFTPPPSGTFPAICYRIIDLGTHEVPGFQGAPPKSQRQVMISWELKADEAVTDDGKPMTMHKTYNWSMHEKATLRKHLESWRGKAFSEADFGEGGFDVKKLLGVPCFMSILHNEKDGNVWANISGISKLPKDYPMAGRTLVNPTAYLFITADEFDEEVLTSLSDKLQLKIKTSPEYQRMTTGAVDHFSSGDEIPF
jgi:hypothetical protein